MEPAQFDKGVTFWLDSAKMFSRLKTSLFILTAFTLIPLIGAASVRVFDFDEGVDSNFKVVNSDGLFLIGSSGPDVSISKGSDDGSLEPLGTISGGIESSFVIAGDFTITVRFDLDTFGDASPGTQPLNEAVVGIEGNLNDESFLVLRRRNASSDQIEGVSSIDGPLGAQSSSLTTGLFQIQRSGGLITGRFSDDNGVTFTNLGSSTGFTSTHYSVRLLGLQGTADATSRRSTTALAVSFDDLVIATPGPITTAVSPNPAGTWALIDSEVSYSILDEGDILFSHDQTILDQDAVTINSNNTYSTSDGETGQWVFARDRLSVISPYGNENIAISENLDTLFFAFGDEDPIPEGTFATVDLEIAVRLPTDSFDLLDVAGTWKVLRETLISFSGTDDSGDPLVFFNAVDHSEESLVLSPNGTFTVTETFSTDPGSLDPPFGGTWGVSGTSLQLSTSEGTFQLDSISDGLDTAIQREVESFPQDRGANLDRTVSVFIKEAESLTAADVVGRWGVALRSLAVDDDTPDPFLQTFYAAFFELGNLEFRGDNTGIYTRIDTNEPGLLRTESFNWSISGSELVINAPDGDVYRLSISAQKDFGAGFFREDRPGTSGDTYELAVICKLPNAPGFASLLPGISGVGVREICVQSLDGFWYQLQRSNDLFTWINVGGPIRGDGNEICQTDSASIIEGAFYRWILVPEPIAVGL